MFEFDHQGHVFRRQFVLLIVAILMLSRPVLAEEPVNISDIRGCRTIAADADRLHCYDTVADGGIFNEQQLEQVRKESFGISEKEPETAIDRVTVNIVKVTKSSTGIYYFYTEEGAIWKQSTGRRWSVKAPFEAEIKSGAIGSFFLVSESGKSTRVKRVR